MSDAESALPPVDARYSRHCLLPEIGEAGQRRLLSARVTIAGCGALGALAASHLARAGVGQLRLVDRDFVDLGNLQRQALFDEDDVAQKLPKAEAARRKLARINGSIHIEAIVGDIVQRNVESLVEGASLVLDGTDNAETRYLLNDACLKHGIPWIYGGVMGTRGLVMGFTSREGPCLHCLYPQPPSPGSLPTCDTVGVLATAPALVATLQATHALKLLVGEQLDGALWAVDPWRGTFERIEVARNPDCPACARREFGFLHARQTSSAARLCGRDMVQISPPEQSAPIDLERLARALAGAVPVRSNGYLLEIRPGDREITVFADGRILVKGTTDETEARALAARYIAS